MKKKPLRFKCNRHYWGTKTDSQGREHTVCQLCGKSNVVSMNELRNKIKKDKRKRMAGL